MIIRVLKNKDGELYPVLLHESLGKVTRVWVQVDEDQVAFDLPTYSFEALEKRRVRVLG
jgi:hypothetical protein